MINFFSRKRKFNDLSWMHVDVHNHILPGIDDGSPSAAESVGLLQSLQAMGIRQFYATPHVQEDIFPNNRTTIRAAYQQLVDRPELRNCQLRYAAEYMVDASFIERVQQDDTSLVSLPDKHLLIEMSCTQESPVIEDAIRILINRGWKPVLAHPERYVYYHSTPEKIKRFKDLGCLLQVNLLSCYGYYGTKERDTVKYLTHAGLVDLVGTNVHYERHVRAIERYMKKEDLSPFFEGLRNEELFSITQRVGYG